MATTTTTVESLSSVITSAITSSVISSIESSSTSVSSADTTTEAPSATSSKLDHDSSEPGAAQKFSGISLNAFLSALVASLIIFAVQLFFFFILRRLPRLFYVYMPKIFLVPRSERTPAPPSSLLGLIRGLYNYDNREIIDKCGLDAYFFLRYLKTLLVIFVPIAFVAITTLVPVNYIGGRGRHFNYEKQNSTSETVTGLDTLAWSNVRPENSQRYAAHLVIAILVIIWVCCVFMLEMKAFIKVRHDYLLRPTHRIRTSASTVLINSIPNEWLNETSLRVLFNGSQRNNYRIDRIWINRDMTPLIDLIEERDEVHELLEEAQTNLIKKAVENFKKKYASQQKNAKDAAKKQSDLAFANIKGKLHRNDTNRSLDSQDSDDNNYKSWLHWTANLMKRKGSQSSDKAQLLGRSPSRAQSMSSQATSSSSMSSSSTTLRSPAQVRSASPHLQNKKSPSPSRSGSPRRPHSRAVQSRSGSRRSASTNDLYQQGGAGPVRANSFPGANPAPPVPAPNNPFNNAAAPIVRSYSSPLSFRYNPYVSKPEKTTFRDEIESVQPYRGKIFNYERVRLWQFWKPPIGSFPYPHPYMRLEKKNTVEQSIIPSWRGFFGLAAPMPKAIKPIKVKAMEYNENEISKRMGSMPFWETHVAKKDRPTHRVAYSDWYPDCMVIPGLGVGKTVDTIYWCRQRLAQLTMEIDNARLQQDRFPVLKSAFIKFHTQLDAHHACQSVIHHSPNQMAPRLVDVSPQDVIWKNMALSWWQASVRTAIAYTMVAAMVIFWTIPVAFTASLGQLDSLVERYEWLRFLTKNKAIERIAASVVGVLPALILALLLVLVPVVFQFLGTFKGSKTGAQREEFVQQTMFTFLFFQVFLVVSIASFFVASLDDLLSNIEGVSREPLQVLDILAHNLPKSANYFFSYMILQALSTSSATLLQLWPLILSHVQRKMLDSTARQKWRRLKQLNEIKWGTFFPVYTNFACIALVFCVIAPLISVFAIITFTLLWFAQRYNMVYVSRFQTDTGGMLYPRAINQTFTGLYVMELCMAGLFFLVTDEKGRKACTVHGTMMMVMFVATVVFQIYLNRSFGPLLRYLPVSCENDAVRRDKIFHRYGKLVEVDRNGGEAVEPGSKRRSASRLGEGETIDVVAKDGDDSSVEGPQDNAARRKSSGGSKRVEVKEDKANDLAASETDRFLDIVRAIVDKSWINLEDLSDADRSRVAVNAYQHIALRSPPPIVWIPEDLNPYQGEPWMPPNMRNHIALGVALDEKKRCRVYSEMVTEQAQAAHALFRSRMRLEQMQRMVRVRYEQVALDTQNHVIFGTNPPEYQPLDYVNV